jgi:hypothetical protein
MRPREMAFKSYAVFVRVPETWSNQVLIDLVVDCLRLSGSGCHPPPSGSHDKEGSDESRLSKVDEAVE